MITEKISAKIFGEAGRFIVTGFLNTGIDFGVLYLLMFFTGKDSGIFTLVFPAISFSIATVNSFFMNKYWTFKQDRNDKKQEMGDFGQFLIVTLGGLFINSGITFLVSNLIAPFLGITAIVSLLDPQKTQSFWVLFSKAMATGVSLVWNFLGYKFWVFKKTEDSGNSRVSVIEK